MCNASSNLAGVSNKITIFPLLLVLWDVTKEQAELTMRPAVVLFVMSRFDECLPSLDTPKTWGLVSTRFSELQRTFFQDKPKTQIQ